MICIIFFQEIKVHELCSTIYENYKGQIESSSYVDLLCSDIWRIVLIFKITKKNSFSKSVGKLCIFLHKYFVKISVAKSLSKKSFSAVISVNLHKYYVKGHDLYKIYANHSRRKKPMRFKL